MTQHTEQYHITEAEAALGKLLLKIIKGSTESEISARSVAAEAIRQLDRPNAPPLMYVAAYEYFRLLAGALLKEMNMPHDVEPEPDYAALAPMTDAEIQEKIHHLRSWAAQHPRNAEACWENRARFWGWPPFD